MTTYTLTTNTDNVTGTNSTDTITGTTDTWQQADQINGSGIHDIDRLEITALSAPAAVIGDAMFQHVSNVEHFALLGKYAANVTLGALSNATGITELDGSGLTGNLTVNAAGHTDSITIDSAQGINTLTGTISDDRFRFTSKGLTATDVVDGAGNGDHDVLEITDKAAVTDAAFKHVSNVEIVAFGDTTYNHVGVDHTGQKITLGANSITAGIQEVDVENNAGATLDASGRQLGITFNGNSGDDTLIASQGSDHFFGNDGNDTFQAKGAQFASNDQFDGGAGKDRVVITDSGTAITDLTFSGLHSVESLVFSSTGKQTVTLDATAAHSGLDTIDAAKVTGGLNLTVKNTFNQDLIVDLGSGADTVTLGDGSQHTVVMKSSSLTAADHITGNGNGNDHLVFSDAVKISDKFFAGAVNVDKFGYLELASDAKGQTFTAGDTFKTFVASDHLQEIIATGDDANTSITFDFSKYTGKQLLVNGSGGGDIFLAGSTDMIFYGTATNTDQGVADSFRFHSADFGSGDVLLGGKSRADEVMILDDSTIILDSDFAQVNSVETLTLAVAKSGFYQAILGADADSSGIRMVDAGKAGVNTNLDAHSMSNNVIFKASAKDNTLVGGSGDDSFVFDTKTLNDSDVIKGGMSTHGDKLVLTTAGTVSATALSHVTNIEFVELSDKGNSITLSDTFVGGGETITTSRFDGFQLQAKEFILTGKGKDTVDLSNLQNQAGEVVVVGSAGDKYIGSKGEDYFVFQHSSDLTANTTIVSNGGGDHLLLAAGTYTADQFKGVSGVTQMVLSDADHKAAFDVSIDNAFVKNVSGSTLNIYLDDAMTGPLTFDASKMTDASIGISIGDTSSGVNHITGGAGDDYARFDIDAVTGQSNLNAADSLDGGAGNDYVLIGNASYNGAAILTDSDISHLTSVETLGFYGGATQWHLTLDSAFQAAGIVNIDLSSTGDKCSVDATQYTTDLTVNAGTANDLIFTGTGNDTVEFENGNFSTATLSSGYILNGGAGHNNLLFFGSATIGDADFTNVSKFQEIDLESGKFNVTLGTHSDAAGITRVDASEAILGVQVNGTGSSKDLSIIGGDGGDFLVGGAGNDHLTGGANADVLEGKAGVNTFSFHSTADSYQDASLSHMDLIVDFTGSDHIDIDALVGGVNAVTNLGTGAFATGNVNGFFGGNEVAVAFDGNNTTRLYVDANHDGNFSLNQDVVVQLIGNHTTELSDVNTYQ